MNIPSLLPYGTTHINTGPIENVAIVYFFPPQVLIKHPEVIKVKQCSRCVKDILCCVSQISAEISTLSRPGMACVVT